MHYLSRLRTTGIAQLAVLLVVSTTSSVVGAPIVAAVVWLVAARLTLHLLREPELGVHEHGLYLTIASKTHRVALCNVVAVEQPGGSWFDRARLVFERDVGVGLQLAYTPPLRLLPIGPHPAVQELRRRVVEAHRDVGASSKSRELAARYDVEPTEIAINPDVAALLRRIRHA